MGVGILSSQADPRPATRIGRTLLLPGGAVRRLSHFERLLFALGIRKSINPHQEKGEATWASGIRTK